MIFKIKHDSGVEEYVQSKNIVHLVTSYDEDSDVGSISSIETITEDEAKTLMLKNIDADEDMPSEISLFDLVCSDEDFIILGSSEW